MIKFEDGTLKYYDKNGKEITAGCMIQWPDGKKQKIYLTEEGELGTDATNPVWVKSGRAVPCQFGIYPLTEIETEEVEVVEYDKNYNEYDIDNSSDEFTADPECSGLLDIYQIDEIDLKKLKKYLSKQVNKKNGAKINTIDKQEAADLLDMLNNLEKIED